MLDLKAKLESINEVERFILLLLRAKNQEPIPGQLWLQKEMFLLNNVFPILNQETDFEPYFLGPYSETVAEEAKQLETSGLVKFKDKHFELTSRGHELAEQIAKHAEKKELEKTEEFKEFENDLTSDELLAFTYFSFPEWNFGEESVEYKALLPKRKRLALSLYQKGKISAEKAAEIAGIALEEFIYELKQVA